MCNAQNESTQLTTCAFQQKMFEPRIEIHRIIYTQVNKIGDVLGTFLGPIWDIFGSNLGPFWNHFGILKLEFFKVVSASSQFGKKTMADEQLIE